ncbi:hypothetical protein [Paraburkholderia sp. BCC1885]|uniref:hypothetical protein n=1 Tax=Paraburkholderia sp. BCC1885 TaxID=2562669 RepID=UPI0016435FC7|nr:hypothetical protein [Paraburkholderia sp. BCC1885]
MDDTVDRRYAVQRPDWTQAVVTVWPVAPLDMSGMISVACTCCATVFVAFIVTADVGIVVSALWAFYLGWLFLWGRHNRGRRVLQLTVSPVAIVCMRRGVPVESIAVGSIVRIYLSAPGAKEIDVHPWRVGRVDPGSRIATGRSVAGRSWQMMVEGDDGARHCMAGGMVLTVALTVAKAICAAAPM